jgi:hypothetical protein
VLEGLVLYLPFTWNGRVSGRMNWQDVSFIAEQLVKQASSIMKLENL